MLTPKNWTTFQHYHDRRPPWVKLHKSLLDDVDYLCLPDASKALAPFLWLLASEYEGGQITLTMPKLAIRLRMSEAKLMEGLKPLIDEGFFVASELLAEVEQNARLDREETEKESEKNIPTSAVAPAGKSKRDPKPKVLGDWPPELDQAVSVWRDLNRVLRSDQILAKFKPEQAQFIAQVGTKGKTWEAWKKRAGTYASGIKVTDAHILGAVELWASRQMRQATEGKSLSAKSLPALINNPDFDDALIHVAAQEVPHAS